MCTFTNPAHSLSMKHQQKYILLLGNDCEQSLQLTRLLQQYWGSAAVQLADNVEALLEHIERRKPDVIILLGVEKKGNYYIDCIKNMRSNKGIDHIPVCIYSTFPVQKDLDRLWEQINVPAG